MPAKPIPTVPSGISLEEERMTDESKRPLTDNDIELRKWCVQMAVQRARDQGDVNVAKEAKLIEDYLLSTPT